MNPNPGPSEKLKSRLWEELKLALLRVGIGPNAMNWVLKFARQNIDELSKDEWNNLSFELAVFGMVGGIAGDKLENSHYQGEWSNDIGPFSVPRRDEAIELQDSIKTHLELIRKKHRTIIRFPEFVYSVGESGTMPMLLKATGSQAFLYRFAPLLGKYADKLRNCSECSTRYVAVRRMQLYCSRACQNRAGIKTFRLRLTIAKLSSQLRRLRRGSKQTKRGETYGSKKRKR